MADMKLPGTQAVSTSRAPGAAQRASSATAACWSPAYITPKIDKMTSKEWSGSGSATESAVSQRTCRLACWARCCAISSRTGSVRACHLRAALSSEQCSVTGAGCNVQDPGRRARPRLARRQHVPRPVQREPG